MNINTAFKKENRRIHLSSRFTFTLSKQLDGLSNVKGSTAWWANRVNKIYGICSETLCPTDTSLSDEESLKLPISKKAFEVAKKLRTAYYQRLYTVEDCFHAIKFTPLVLSFECFENVRTANKGLLKLPRVGERYLGSHCVTVVAFSEKDGHFIFQNSWGVEWGNKGLGYLPFEYFDHDLIVEIWAINIFLHLSEDKELNTKVFNFFTAKRQPFIVKRTGYASMRATKETIYSLDMYGEDGEFIGYSHISGYAPNYLEIEELFIHPKYQNLGFGSSILNFIEKTAKANNFSNIIGWIGAQDVIPQRKRRVLHFFKKNGYKLIFDNSRFKDAVYKFEKTLI